MTGQIAAEAAQINSELLRRVPLFRAVNGAGLRALADAARLAVYPDGAAVVEQGQVAEAGMDESSLYIIVDGSARVVYERAGREEVLAILRAGDFFGEMTLLDGKPRSATVVAAEDTQCLILARWDLLRAIRRDPDIAIELLTVMSERLRAMQNLTAYSLA